MPQGTGSGVGVPGHQVYRSVDRLSLLHMNMFLGYHSVLDLETFPYWGICNTSWIYERPNQQVCQGKFIYRRAASLGWNLGAWLTRCLSRWPWHRLLWVCSFSSFWLSRYQQRWGWGQGIHMVDIARIKLFLLVGQKCPGPFLVPPDSSDAGPDCRGSCLGHFVQLWTKQLLSKDALNHQHDGRHVG